MQDPEFAELVDEHVKQTDSKKRTKMSGGRPRKDKDPEHHDWRVKFCEELLRTKSRSQASLVTPYSEDEIYMMLNEKYSSFDTKFAEMVHLVEMRMVAWAESEIWTSLEQAKTPKDKAWIAKEILKVRDRQRWGDKLDVNVSGSIQHRLPEQRARLMIELVGDQKNWLESGLKHQQQLPATTSESVPIDFGYNDRVTRMKEKEEVIDVEPIEVEPEEEDAESSDSTDAI